MLRLPILILVFLVFSAINVTAMDDASDDEQKSLMSEQTDEDVNYQQKILIAITGYKDGLNQSLGCCIARGFSSLVKTDKFKHVQERLTMLERYYQAIAQTKDLRDLSHQLLVLTADIQTAKSLCGRAFGAYCLTNMAAIEEALVPEGSECSDLCLICWERPKIMARFPCLHLAFCGHCYIQKKNVLDNNNNCDVCRASVSDYILIDQLCASCSKNKADYVGECGHPNWCKTCLEKHQNEPCPTCKLESKGSKPIYY
jgi:hypothetical protein